MKWRIIAWTTTRATLIREGGKEGEGAQAGGRDSYRTKLLVRRSPHVFDGGARFGTRARIAPGEESARGRTGDRMRRPLEQRDLEMCVVYCDDV